MSGPDVQPSGGRPRVLIPITIMFAVRYVVRTGLLRRLVDDCEPVLALSWDDPALVAELEAAGFEVVRLPDPRVDAPAAALLRRLEVHFTRRLASPSTRLDRERKALGWSSAKRRRSWLARQRDQLLARRPGDERRARAELIDGLGAHTNAGDCTAFLRDLRIDALFSVTPFVSQELVLLLAAEQAGVACWTSILSFDNLTTRPPLPIVFDHYLVWNRYNRDEVLRAYPSVAPDQVTIVGAAQFDFYADASLVEPEPAWRARLGLPPEGPTVLFGAGSVHIAPHETQHVDDLTAAIDAGELPADVRVVLRRHPLDQPERWERFRSHPAVAFDDPGRLGDSELRPGQVNLDEHQIVGLCSTLAHTDVHLSVSSTMTLDGAFFDKPQIGPAYDEVPPRTYDRLAQDLYRREHFVPLVASGGIELVRSPAELVAAVRRHLADPAAQRPGRQRMLEDLCTFTDGASTERVADACRALLAALPRRR